MEHVGGDLLEVELAVRELPLGQRPSRLPVGCKPHGSEGVIVAHDYSNPCCGELLYDTKSPSDELGSPVRYRIETPILFGSPSATLQETAEGCEARERCK